MPRLRSRVRISFPAPDNGRFTNIFCPRREAKASLFCLVNCGRYWRGSKAVMHRIANPCRSVRLRPAPPSRDKGSLLSISDEPFFLVVRCNGGCKTISRIDTRSPMKIPPAVGTIDCPALVPRRQRLGVIVGLDGGRNLNLGTHFRILGFRAYRVRTFVRTSCELRTCALRTKSYVLALTSTFRSFGQFLSRLCSSVPEDDFDLHIGNGHPARGVIAG